MRKIIALAFIAFSASAQTNSPTETTVNGSVFIVLKNAENIKLALAPVYVMSEPVFNEISKLIKPVLDQKIKSSALAYFEAELANSNTRQINILTSLKDFDENAYFSEPITKSDGDGKFTLTFNDSMPKVIAVDLSGNCRTEREIRDTNWPSAKCGKIAARALPSTPGGRSSSAAAR